MPEVEFEVVADGLYRPKGGIRAADLPAANQPYRPQGAIRKLWKCQDSEILCDGPAGTGKTRGVLEIAFRRASEYPRCRILFVRKTRSSLTQTILVTWESKVLPVRHPVLQGPSRTLRQSYVFPNGSEIVVGGLDKDIKIMSSEYDLICVFEATEIAEGEYEAMISRLRNGVIPWQQIICECNPSAPSHWIKRRADDGVSTRFISRHEDNPLLWNGTDWTDAGREYMGKLERLTGHRYARLRKGIWAPVEGLVYPDFDAAVHIIDRLWDRPPRHWRKFRSVDFGYTNPFVCQWWAVDGDGRLIMYREIYRTQGLVEDHAREIVKLTADEAIETTVVDHDAEDSATLRKHGVPTTSARKAISVGLQLVAERLRIAGDGKPRLMLFRDSLVEADTRLLEASQPVSTIGEFEWYVWPQDPDGKPKKEVPVDLYNHGMDAMRYAVSHVDHNPGGRRKVRRVPNKIRRLSRIYE